MRRAGAIVVAAQRQNTARSRDQSGENADLCEGECKRPQTRNRQEQGHECLIDGACASSGLVPALRMSSWHSYAKIKVPCDGMAIFAYH